MDMSDAVVRVQDRVRLAVGHVNGGRGEGIAEGIIKVAALHPRAAGVGALDVEQGAMQGDQVLRHVICALRQVVDVLGDAEEVLLLVVAQGGEGAMAVVGARLQAAVAAVTVKEPDEARVGLEGAHGSQLGGIVTAPETSGAAESGQTGGC